MDDFDGQTSSNLTEQAPIANARYENLETG